jgi:hypothetical protein
LHASAQGSRNVADRKNTLRRNEVSLGRGSEQQNSANDDAPKPNEQKPLSGAELWGLRAALRQSFLDFPGDD